MKCKKRIQPIKNQNNVNKSKMQSVLFPVCSDVKKMTIVPESPAVVHSLSTSSNATVIPSVLETPDLESRQCDGKNSVGVMADSVMDITPDLNLLKRKVTSSILDILESENSFNKNLKDKANSNSSSYSRNEENLLKKNKRKSVHNVILPFHLNDREMLKTRLSIQEENRKAIPKRTNKTQSKRSSELNNTMLSNDDTHSDNNKSLHSFDNSNLDLTDIHGGNILLHRRTNSLKSHGLLNSTNYSKNKFINENISRNLGENNDFQNSLKDQSCNGLMTNNINDNLLEISRISFCDYSDKTIEGEFSPINKVLFTDFSLSHNEPISLILSGVIVYVDVRSRAENRSNIFEDVLRNLGADVKSKLSADVTHVVFRDGSKSTYQRAIQRKLRLVSPLWVDACLRKGVRVSEDLFPISREYTKQSCSPLISGKAILTRKLRSMQPIDLESEMRKAETRLQKRNKRLSSQHLSSSRPEEEFCTPPKLRLLSASKEVRDSPLLGVDHLLTPVQVVSETDNSCTDLSSSEKDLGTPLATRMYNKIVPPKMKSMSVVYDDHLNLMEQSSSGLSNLQPTVLSDVSNSPRIAGTSLTNDTGRSMQEITGFDPQITSDIIRNDTGSDFSKNISGNNISINLKTNISSKNSNLTRDIDYNFQLPINNNKRNGECDRNNKENEKSRHETTDFSFNGYAIRTRSRTRSNFRNISRLSSIESDNNPSDIEFGGSNATDSNHSSNSHDMDQQNDSVFLPDVSGNIVSSTRISRKSSTRIKLSRKIKKDINALAKCASYTDELNHSSSSQDMNRQSDSVLLAEASNNIVSSTRITRKRSTKKQKPEKVIFPSSSEISSDSPLSNLVSSTCNKKNSSSGKKRRLHTVDVTPTQELIIPNTPPLTDPKDKPDCPYDLISQRNFTQRERLKFQKRLSNNITSLPIPLPSKTKNSVTDQAKPPGSASSIITSIDQTLPSDSPSISASSLPLTKATKSTKTNNNLSGKVNKPSGSTSSLTPVCQTLRIDSATPVSTSSLESNTTPTLNRGAKSRFSVINGQPNSLEEFETKEKQRRRKGHYRNRRRNRKDSLSSICITSFHSSAIDGIYAIVKSLGGYRLVTSVDHTTSHVVCGSDRRTLNVLKGISMGCWVLDSSWFYDSVQLLQWAPEEPFELFNFCPGVKISRESRENAAQAVKKSLFSECGRIFVSETCSPPRSDILELLHNCDANVSSTIRSADLIIGNSIEAKNTSFEIAPKSVSPRWLFDCIHHWELKDVNEYLL